MPNKIPIYASNYYAAAKLAATMNLSLRHWEWAGVSNLGSRITWANVGDVLDSIDTTEGSR